VPSSPAARRNTALGSAGFASPTWAIRPAVGVSMLSHMAAAASADHVSPELALVDPALATRLRAVRDVLPTEALEPVTVTVRVELEGSEPPESPDPERPPAYDVDDPIADLIVHEPSAQPVEPVNMFTEEHEPSADLLVETASPKGEVSGYPSLPQPDAANLEALDAAEAALREIRDRLTEPTSGRERRRFRRRFIVASGLSVAAALGVLAASAALGAATPYS
jgi:hypothetical protein